MLRARTTPVAAPATAPATAPAIAVKDRSSGMAPSKDPEGVLKTSKDIPHHSSQYFSFSGVLISIKLKRQVRRALDFMVISFSQDDLNALGSDFITVVELLQVARSNTSGLAEGLCALHT